MRRGWSHPIAPSTFASTTWRWWPATRQVIDNLLANVRSHTAPGVACRVEVRSDGVAALLTVEDDGEGLRPEELATATERFYRADPSRDRRRGGAGLGLSIVTSIVEAHQGTLSLMTADGHGVRVVVRLPITPPSPRSSGSDS
jgi:two-component system OmpR family sensor kinase